MGLLEHNQKKSKKLDRGAQIVVNNQVKRKQVIPENNSITFPVNIRVDNHIRNQISALLNLGIAKSNKDMVQKLVDQKIDELSESEKTRYNKMYSILEQKDFLDKS